MANEAAESRPDPEDEEGGPVKPFLEHLEDLRWVLIKCVAALGIAMTGCMAGAPLLMKVLTRPLAKSGTKISLQFFGPVGGFMVSMKVAFYGGIVIALPFILYYIGQFILPALKAKEKKYFLRAFIIGAGLFLAGVFLCYFLILDISLKAMAQYNQWLGLPTDIWRAEEYFQFVCLFMLSMGISFEFPVLVLTLVRIGLLPHEWLIKGRRYFFVINLVICSFITPDAVSTIFMVVPVQILLEICIWISKRWEKQKRLAESALTPAGADLPASD